jgi:hypothetical protein
MANNNRNEMYSAWTDYYQKGGKESVGWIGGDLDPKISVFDDFPTEYAGDPEAFKELIVQNPNESFILIPAGNELVKCLHSCFVFEEPDKPAKVVGIMGMRRSSPFKILNVDHAVKRLAEPRATRSGSRSEAFIPSMEEFLECEDEDQFKNLTSEDEENVSTSDLWKRAQTAWVHPKIFELMEESNEQRAGKLAITIMRALPQDNEELVDQAHQLVTFLWAIENLHSTKVNLDDAPTSYLFDQKAQEITDRLKRPMENQDGEPDNRDPSSDGEAKRRGRESPSKRGREHHREDRNQGGRVARRGDGSPSSGGSTPSNSRSPPRRSRSRSPSPARHRSRSRSRSEPRDESEPRERSRSNRRPRTKRTGKSRTERRRRRTPSPSRSRSRSRSASRSSSSSRSRGRDGLQKAMIDNLTAITASHLRADARKDEKKSMLSKLAPEAAKLFDLLAAMDWRDHSPRMTRFAKDLVSDRDSNRACGIMRTKTKNWSGEISERGFVAFLATGFAAPDIHRSPGGFTVFMFRPISAQMPSSKTDRRQYVKAMFGKIEIDDEAIKYYAESDFFLPQTMSDLEEQIQTCIQALELLTGRKSIAVEGYAHGLQMLQQNRRLFKNFLQDDALFAVKFAYLLDRVFQNFVNRLGDFYKDREPIRKARRALEASQTRGIERALVGYEVSNAPRLFLPNSLRKTFSDPPDDKHQEKGGGGGGGGHPGKSEEPPKEKAPNPKFWTKNQNPVSAWRLPAGKTFPDYFSSQTAEKKANTVDWPKVPHHKHPKKLKFLCVKYQSTGSCSASCFMSHIDPQNIEGDVRKTIDDRFKLIFA